MPVPEDLFFGIFPGKGEIYYGDVRKADPDQRLSMLEHRLRHILIKQIDELSISEDSERKVYSPFPLAILTCIAIETLGQIFHRRDNKRDEKDQKYSFVEVIKQFDKAFSRPLTQNYKNKLKERFPDEGVHNAKNRAEIFHSYFRNTFMHGYRARVVYLSEEDTSTWMDGDGYITINPNWFWKRFLVVFAKYFKKLEDNKKDNNPLRISALTYIEDLLK